MPHENGFFEVASKSVKAWLFSVKTTPTQRVIKEREVLFVFAIIKTGGKQYKVNEGDIIFVEKLIANEGDTVVFDEVVAISRDDQFVAGTPTVAGATVNAVVLKQGKGKKLHILRYKAKKNEKKKIGHRQPYTKVQIGAINA